MLATLSVALAAKVREVVARDETAGRSSDRAGAAALNAPASELSVTLLEPAAGAVTTAPGYLLLRADARPAAGGAVTKVEFFDGDRAIGTCVAPPYLFAWRDVPAGDHTLKVRATDDKGNSVTMSGTTVSVKPPPVGKTMVAAASGDVGRLMSELTPGDTLVIKPGTYTENLRVPRSGTPDRPITIRAERPGTVVIQAAAPTLALLNGDDTSHVIVSGITFRGGGASNQNNHQAAVRAGAHWRVEDCTVEKANGAGITMMEARGTVFLRVTAQDNGRAGIGGSKVKGSMVLDCVSRRNNPDGDGNGGGGKFTRVDGMLVEGHQSYENTGPGIWFDYNNINVVVRRCHVHHNRDSWNGPKLEVGSAAIFFEISGMVEKSRKHGHLLAEQNYVHDNGREGIFVYASRNVTVRDNTLVNDPVVLNDDRPKPWALHDVTITGNRFKDAGIEADKDTAKGSESENIRIDGNTYDGPKTLIEWGSRKCRTLDAARALGFEQAGKLGNVDPPDWVK